MSWLTIIGWIAPFLPSKILGISTATIIAWLGTPEAKAAATALQGVITALKQNGDTEIAAGVKALAMVAKAHKMTPAEEEIWMNRASNTGAQ